MPRTAAQYVLSARHALGKTPDARHDLFETYNQAGRALFNCHEWTWRVAVATLPAVAEQNYLDLPADYGGFVWATIPTAGLFSRLTTCALRDIIEMRAASSAVGSGLFYIFLPTWATRVNLESTQTPKAEVYPTPSEDASPTVTLAYRRNWIDSPSADAARVPDIPPPFEAALEDICRAFACLRENGDPSAPAPYPDVRTFPMVKALMDQDGDHDLELTLRGGVNSRPRWGGPDTDTRNIDRIDVS